MAGVVFPLTEERGGREGRGREEGGRGREEGRDSPIILAFLTFSIYKKYHVETATQSGQKCVEYKSGELSSDK